MYVHMQEVSLYKATQDMEYLDMVVQEALRLYSPAPQWADPCIIIIFTGVVWVGGVKRVLYGFILMEGPLLMV
jgi:hypothetical protein